MCVPCKPSGDLTSKVIAFSYSQTLLPNLHQPRRSWLVILVTDLDVNLHRLLWYETTGPLCAESGQERRSKRLPEPRRLVVREPTQAGCCEVCVPAVHVLKSIPPTVSTLFGLTSSAYRGRLFSRRLSIMESEAVPTKVAERNCVTRYSPEAQEGQHMMHHPV